MIASLARYFDFADHASWRDKLFVLLQYAVPQHMLSRAVGILAECDIPMVKDTLIHHFIAHFGVDMNQAAQMDYRQYRHFNDFFTRALADGQRPLADAPVISPADGAISQAGSIEDGHLFQAKGHRYTTLELLGGDSELAQRFDGGQFATVYLSPRDYHRVHMPVAGTLLRTVYVPGDLFSVNTVTADNVPRLFSRNERLVCIFDTPLGDMALVLVGAMIVAGIETVWGGQVCPRRRVIDTRDFTQPAPVITLAQGEEMGRFKLGSTAIILFRNDAAVQWNIQTGDAVRMGQAIVEAASATDDAALAP